jgi:hypothetical protein
MITLEERLRAHYAERTAMVPDRGPGLDAPRSLSSFDVDNDLRASRWRMAIIGSAAAAMIVGLVLVAGFRSGDDAPAPAASGPAAADQGALAPAVTLAEAGDLTDVPVTVLSAAPTEWYRLAPDLDVAWYQDQVDGGVSMVCWRSPVGSDCQADNSRPGESVFVVPSGGGQTLVVMIAGDTRSEALDVVLDDGAVLESRIEWDDAINWGVARYAIPDGAVIARVGESAAVPSDTISDAASADVQSSTSLLGPTDSCEETNGCEYIVRTGDYPVMIAERFCVTITELADANGWSDISEFPFPDVPISIPSSGVRTTCPDPTG